MLQLPDEPVLEPLARRALHCWRFCGGWSPERWPVYAALYPVPDWHLLIDAMQTLQTTASHGHR